jgi:hypothetical protein
MNIKKIKPWKVIIAALILMSIPSMFVFLLERYTTSNEKFCMTCHYKMWGKNFLVHSNIHPDSVRCPQCHAKHGEIIPKDFSAHPDRINPNCVRCHRAMFKKEDTKGFKYNVMNIYIPHKLHLQKVGALCTDCHYNIKHDKFRPVTNRPHMQACMACHDQKTTHCSKCHQRGASEVLAALPVTPHIVRKTCKRCHEGFAERTISFYGTDFPHKKHLAQGLKCQECHSNASVHGQIIKSREQCMACHHQKRKEACVDCHTFEKNFRNGTALADIQGKPGPMADTVTCNVCHADIAKGHSKEAVLKVCANCHEESEYKNKVNEFQRQTGEKLQEVENLLKRAKKVAEDLPESSTTEVNVLLAKSEKILETAKKDRSHGFHNPAYSALLLKDAEDKLQKVVSWQVAKVNKE